MALTEKLLETIWQGLSYQLKKTDLFQHEGQWVELKDFLEFVLLVAQTRQALGFCTLFIVEDKKVLWVHAADNVHYFVRVKKPLPSYIS